MKKRKRRSKRRRAAVRNKKHRNESASYQLWSIELYFIDSIFFISLKVLTVVLHLNVKLKAFVLGVLRIWMINWSRHDVIEIISGSLFSWLNRRYCCASDILLVVVTIKLSLLVVFSHCISVSTCIPWCHWFIFIALSVFNSKPLYIIRTVTYEMFM